MASWWLIVFGAAVVVYRFLRIVLLYPDGQVLDLVKVARTTCFAHPKTQHNTQHNAQHTPHNAIPPLI